MKGFKNQILTIIAVIFLIGLLKAVIDTESLLYLFRGNMLDTLIGSVIGSVFAGNASTSYILGGELLDIGVNTGAVASFVAAWVTVGLIQFPVESKILGFKFAFKRNLVNFFIAVLIGVLLWV